MTPLRVLQAINRRVYNDFANHVNTSLSTNPHATTKADVGLGSVVNYGVATQAEAQTMSDGASNAKYMTPWLVYRALITHLGRTDSASVLSSASAHINNTSNPHGTTAAQVGLGNVANYGVASQVDAETGSSNGVYMTPLRTFQAIARYLANEGVLRSDVAYGGGGWNSIVNKIPFIQSNGVMEFGKYQDWHDTGNDGDYQLREELRWNGAVGWEIYNTGYYNVQDIYIRSDIRDKSRIEAIKDPMSIVRLLQGYRYSLHNADHLTAGLIAQEIQKVFPEAVLVSQNEAGE
jgi:hypothetical protein